MNSRLVEGFSPTRVERWLEGRIEGLKSPLAWKRLTGGHSNITYMLQAASGKRFVIRRPPIGNLLPGAHDMKREWSLISGLGQANFPVPGALAFCDDKEIADAPFYVMTYEDGLTLRTAQDVEVSVATDKRVAVANSLIDTLALLHSLQPEEIGLGQLGKKEGYVGRQITTWYRSWISSMGVSHFDQVLAHELKEHLEKNIPSQAAARIVHGDYGLHNCLVDSDKGVSTVVDWEISTLGDPLVDLAYVLKGWPDSQGMSVAAENSASSAVGFPVRETLIDRYSASASCQLQNFDFYIAFNHWKSAAVLHGVYSRYLEGKKRHDGVDLQALLNRIERELVAAERAASLF